jgi:hypothetical protein
MSDRAITILGFGDSARALLRAGTLAESCVGEVWTLNNAWECYGDSLKADRWFALHTDAAIDATYRGPSGHDPFTRLDTAGCDVFMQTAPHSRVRRSRAFPGVEICRKFGSNFFMGSPSMMLALAIFEGVRHVRAWGLDMADGRHLQQRVAWAFWVHEGMTRGVTFSGCALTFMREIDNDEGLRGLREQWAQTINSDKTGGV